MRLALSLCTLLIGLSAALAAQDHPDFTGRWVLDARSGALGGASELLVTLSGEEDAAVMSVERHTPNGINTMTYSLGRTKSSSSLRRGAGLWRRWENPRTTTASATWEGETLVISTAHYVSYAPDAWPNSEFRESWSLEEDGRLRIVISDREGLELPLTATCVYRRR